jgi:hypothetical protein
MTRSDHDNFEKIPKTAKEEHYKRSRRCPKTKSLERYKSKTAFVLSERGAHRAGLIPTQKPESVTPELSKNLRKRRYSIDANAPSEIDTKRPKLTRDWAIDDIDDKMGIIPATFAFDTSAFVPVFNQAEPMLQQEAPTPFPDPRRHWAYYPHDDALEFNPPSNNGFYLDLPGSSITNEDLLNIRKFDMNGWLTDNSVDVPLELLARRYQCSEHDIEIVQSLVAIQLYQIHSFGDAANDNYAGYSIERNRLSSKRHIFIPISDGIDDTTNESNGSGIHWSFIYVDRELKQASYIDSLFLHDAGHQWLAKHVVDAMGELLGEEYEFDCDWNSPDQQQHNRSPVTDDGPCGPFVIETIKAIVEWIRKEQDAGRELEMIALPDGFGEEYPFESQKIREGISLDIARARMEWVAGKIAKQHDEAALAAVELEEGVIEYHRKAKEASKPAAAAAEEDGFVLVTPPRGSSPSGSDEVKIVE